MGLFDPPAEQNFPRSWREHSFEYNGMFAYHIAMMALFITGALPVFFEIAIAAGIVLIVGLLSIRRRRAMGWRWQPLTAMDLLKAAGTTALIALFLFVASRGFPIGNPHMLPWFLAGAGIGLFGVLRELKLAAFSEKDFAEIGRTVTPAVLAQRDALRDAEPAWHRPVRAIYRIAFVAIWLSMMGFFYLDMTGMQEGSPAPTAAATEPLSDHGRTVYISQDKARLLHLVQAIAFTGIPLIVLSGFALQLLVGVRLFPGNFGRKNRFT